MSKQIYCSPNQSPLDAEDCDESISQWVALAAPIVQKMGLELSGFDPDFQFRKVNPNGPGSTTICLPFWFVRDLSKVLST